MITQDYQVLSAKGYECSVCKGLGCEEYGTSRYHDAIVCKNCAHLAMRNQNSSLSQFNFFARYDELGFINIRVEDAVTAKYLTYYSMPIDDNPESDLWGSFFIKGLYYDLNYFAPSSTLSIFRLNLKEATIQEGCETILIAKRKNCLDSWVRESFNS